MITTKELECNREMEKKGFAIGYLDIRNDAIGFCYGDQAWEFSSFDGQYLRVPNKWMIFAKVKDVKKRAKELGINPIKRPTDC